MFPSSFLPLSPSCYSTTALLVLKHFLWPYFFFRFPLWLTNTTFSFFPILFNNYTIKLFSLIFSCFLNIPIIDRLPVSPPYSPHFLLSDLPISTGIQLASFPALSPTGKGWTQAGTGHNLPVVSECASHCPPVLAHCIHPFALYSTPAPQSRPGCMLLARCPHKTTTILVVNFLWWMMKGLHCKKMLKKSDFRPDY